MSRLIITILTIAAVLCGLATAQAGIVVTVDKSAQRLTVTVDGARRYEWPVSTARIGYMTPNGSYRPERLERQWFSRKYDWSPMPYSIFFDGGYAIHGSYEISRSRPPGLARLHPPASEECRHFVRAGAAECEQHPHRGHRRRLHADGARARRGLRHAGARPRREQARATISSRSSTAPTSLSPTSTSRASAGRTGISLRYLQVILLLVSRRWKLKARMRHRPCSLRRRVRRFPFSFPPRRKAMERREAPEGLRGPFGGVVDPPCAHGHSRLPGVTASGRTRPMT